MLLKDPSLQEEIENTVKDYFSLNDNGETSEEILWDVSKAVIRGSCISMASRLNRSRCETLANLEEELRVAERNHKKDPTSTSILALIMARGNIPFLRPCGRKKTKL